MNRVIKAELYVTTYCEGACPFCFGQGDFGPGGRHVPIETLLPRAGMLRTFHRRNRLYAVPLLGGEPLTHPDLPVLAAEFGDDLPLAVVSAGLPDTGADLETLVPHIRIWGATYNPHLADRFVALVERLLRAGRRVDAAMHFGDFESFLAVNLDFVERALPRLPLAPSWGIAFRRYVDRWNPRTYYAASFSPFAVADHAAMTVHYSAIDARFTRNIPARAQSRLSPDRSYPCHLFSEQKAVAIAEDGRLLPCTSNAQRHAAPVVRDLDRFGRLPDDLAALLDRLAARLHETTSERTCNVGCRDLRWNLDG
jgi:MoaA/NifB/PqqE/SkfB family radical SAM enzyme